MEGVQLRTEEIVEINQRLKELEGLIDDAANDYCDTMLEMGTLTADKIYQKARATLDIHAREGRGQSVKLTDKLREAEALTDPLYKEALYKLAELDNKAKASKARLDAYKAILSAVQSRGQLKKVEASLISYQ